MIIAINIVQHNTMEASLQEKTEATFQKIISMQILVIHMPIEELLQYLKGLKLYKKQEQGHIKGIMDEIEFKRKYERRHIQKQEQTESIFVKLKRFFLFNNKQSTEEELQATNQLNAATQTTNKNGYIALPTNQMSPRKRTSTTIQQKKESKPY